jgi:hypothetical protein
VAIKKKQSKWKNPIYARKMCMNDNKNGLEIWDKYRRMKSKSNPFVKVKE